MDISIFEQKPCIDDIDFKNKYYKSLSNFSLESMPNFIFYGNSGSGKTTKIYAFLCTLLDKKVYTLKNEEVEVEKRLFKFKSSIYHLEIDALELLNNERIFFHNYLKEYCDTRNIGLDLPKIILIFNSDKINKNSLLMLRKLIESTYKSSKFIFEAQSISNIPETLTTRFYAIRIPCPSRKEIENTLKELIKKNKIKITKKNLDKIIDFNIKYSSNYNLNKIFSAFNYYIKKNKLLYDNYHKIVNEILDILLDTKFNFNNISILKNLCEKIFVNCYNPNEIIISINKILCDKYKNNSEMCYKILRLSCNCNLDIETSTGKYFIHLENYFVKLLILLNN